MGKKICSSCENEVKLSARQCEKCDSTSFYYNYDDEVAQEYGNLNEKKPSDEKRPSEEQSMDAFSNVDASQILTHKNFWRKDNPKAIATSISMLFIFSVIAISGINSGSVKTLPSDQNISASSNANTNSEQETKKSTDINLLSRLQSVSGAGWSEDVARPLEKISGYVTAYLASDTSGNGNCNLSVFDSEENAKLAVNSNQTVDLGISWYGTDSISGQGVVLSTDDSNNSCVAAAYKVLNWSDPTAESKSSASLPRKFTETLLRRGLKSNCSNLPRRFDTMKFKSIDSTFNNYGNIIYLFSLGATNFSVIDETTDWNVGVPDAESRATLNVWECSFPFKVK